MTNGNSHQFVVNVDCHLGVYTDPEIDVCSIFQKWESSGIPGFDRPGIWDYGLLIEPIDDVLKRGSGDNTIYFSLGGIMEREA